MENKNGSGIFLGIVSVATLIVAIIGATFAYFSATTTSNEGAVNATAYEYSLSLVVNPIYPKGIAPAIIPMDPDGKIYDENGDPYTGTNNTNLLYALNEAASKCVDDNGLQVCTLYQVVITNNATNPITLTGKLITNTNEAAEGYTEEERTGFTNLTYQGLKGNHLDNTLSLNGTAKTIAAEVNGEIDIDPITVTGATTGEGGALVPGTGTSYVLIYLNDNEDQSKEMGASFTGQLEYTSGSGSNGLTATFTVAAPANDENEVSGT